MRLPCAAQGWAASACPLSSEGLYVVTLRAQSTTSWPSLAIPDLRLSGLVAASRQLVFVCPRSFVPSFLHPGGPCSPHCPCRPVHARYASLEEVPTRAAASTQAMCLVLPYSLSRDHQSRRGRVFLPCTNWGLVRWRGLRRLELPRSCSSESATMNDGLSITTYNVRAERTSEAGRPGAAQEDGACDWPARRQGGLPRWVRSRARG